MGELKVIISPRQFSNPALEANKWRFDFAKCPLVEINNARCPGGKQMWSSSRRRRAGNRRARDVLTHKEQEKKKGWE